MQMVDEAKQAEVQKSNYHIIIKNRGILASEKESE